MTELTAPNAESFQIGLGMSESDLPRAAELFDLAFSDKFKKAIPESSIRLRVWESVVDPQQIMAGYLDGNLVSIAVLSFNRKSGFRKGVMVKVLKILGLRRTPLALITFALFEKRISADDLYIEAISVAPDIRGMGLGSTTIEAIRSTAVRNRLKTMTLQVIQGNESAKKLYERHGFVVEDFVENSLMKYLSGINGAYKMRCDIN
jgi:ribosomal protein S18 acetylase RimI-like enzyme